MIQVRLFFGRVHHVDFYPTGAMKREKGIMISSAIWNK